MFNITPILPESQNNWSFEAKIQGAQVFLDNELVAWIIQKIDNARYKLIYNSQSFSIKFIKKESNSKNL